MGHLDDGECWIGQPEEGDRPAGADSNEEGDWPMAGVEEEKTGV